MDNTQETAMEYTKRFLGVRIPSSWGDVLVGALKTIVIGFVALLAWDYIESGDFDPVGVVSNAIAVAIGLFVLDAILIATDR
jgi:hypothetical protein